MIKAPGALCNVCPLCENPFVPSSGSSDASLIVIGEAPGEQEQREGRPFVGPSGKLLDAALKEAGHDPEDTFRTNVVLCRTDKTNREPTEQEIACCHGRLVHELKAAKSDRVLLLGKVAKQPFLTDDSERGVWREINGKMFMPTWHPAYVLRKPSEATALLRDVAKAVSPRITVGWSMPEAVVVDTPEKLEKELAKCPERAPVSYDGEMDQLRWHPDSRGAADAVLALALCWDPSYGVVMDDEMLYDHPQTIPMLQKFFDNRDREWIAHNGKFDDIFFAETFGLRIVETFDTMLAHYLLDENSKHGLKELSSDFLGAPDYEQEMVQRHLRSRNDFYSKVPTPELLKYAACDVSNTLQLYHVFKEGLERNNQYEWPFNNILMPASLAFEAIERRGMKVDVEHLNKWDQRLTDEMTSLQDTGRAIANRPLLNMNSPAQLAVVMYDELGLPMSRDRRIKERSTAHDAVEHLRGKHPFVDLLMKYRHVAKMKSSYIDNLLEAVDPRTGRIHTTALLHGTEVGRISMRDPALQTVPRSGDIYGQAIRSAFIAAYGKKLGIDDYSQAELRVMAAESGDPFLTRVYKEHRDLHSEVAIAMFGPNYTKEQRVMCKMFNFSYAYGGNKYSFAGDAGLDIAVAEQFVENYDSNMPIAKQWKIDLFKKLKDQGYVESLFHRRRRFPLITPLNVDEARKSCVHTIVAGTASDLTLLSLIEAEKRNMNVVLSVHDSILIENDEAVAEEAGRELAKIMQATGEKYLPQVPWEADVEVSDRWVPVPEEA